MNQRFAVQLSTALAFGPTGIIWAFLPIHLRFLHASFFLISLVALVPAIETIILSPLWGGILDRTGKGKKILLLSFLAQTGGFAIFPLLTNPEEFVIVVSWSVCSHLASYQYMQQWPRPRVHNTDAP